MKRCNVVLAAFLMAGLMTLSLTPALAEPPYPPVMLMPAPPPLAPLALSNQVWAPLQLSLFPPIQIPDVNCKVCGLSLGIIAVGGLYDDDVMGLQMGGLWAFARELYGMQVAGLYTLTHEQFSGIQLAGVANFADKMPCGFQIAGIGNFVTRDMGCGLQAAVAFNECESGAGLQVALMNGADKDFNGIQVGLFNRGKWHAGWNEVVTPGGGRYFYRAPPYFEGIANMRGLQVGFWNLVKNSSGIQIGAVNIDDTMAGLQIGLLNQPYQSMQGFQVGFYNRAETMAGVQLGLFNGANKMTGVQIGLFNVIQESPVPFLPIINAHF